MIKFNYVIKRSLAIPESITVKGKDIPVYYDEDAYTNDEGKYYPPSIEYADNADGEDGHDWSIKFIQCDTGEFAVTVKVDGKVKYGDSFTADDDDFRRELSICIEWVEDCL